MLEHRDGERLDQLWGNLTLAQQIAIKVACRHGLDALRQARVRLDDAGMHNILYNEETNAVTLLDFESAVDVENDSVQVDHYMMDAIFPAGLLFERSPGG